MRLLVLFACCALSAGCAFGNVREKEIGALGPYRDMPVRALSVGGPDVPQEVSNELQAGLNRGLESWNKEHAPPGPLTPETVLEVQPELLDVHVAKAGASTTSPVAAAASQIGLAGAVESNRISLLLLLHAPGVSDPIGELHWEGAGGSLSEVASQAGGGSVVGGGVAARSGARGGAGEGDEGAARPLGHPPGVRRALSAHAQRAA